MSCSTRDTAHVFPAEAPIRTPIPALTYARLPLILTRRTNCRATRRRSNGFLIARDKCRLAIFNFVWTMEETLEEDFAFWHRTSGFSIIQRNFSRADKLFKIYRRLAIY
jgi:hypothetical protein